jgi:nucleotide-binding universal stress UspA family protein
MPVPNKILIAVDGSDSSNRACDFAVDLAEKIGSSVVFVHIIEIPVSSYKYRSVAGNILELLDSSARALLSNYEVRASSRDVAYEVVLAHGDPANLILQTSKRKNCDAIVMGKRGQGRIQRVLLGSVTDRVIMLSKVPVTIVK